MIEAALSCTQRDTYEATESNLHSIPLLSQMKWTVAVRDDRSSFWIAVMVDAAQGNEGDHRNDL